MQAERMLQLQKEASICDTKKEETAAVTMRTGEESWVVYPVIVLTVNWIKTRALLDTGGGVAKLLQHC